MSTQTELLLKKVDSAMLSRDFAYAEQILRDYLSQNLSLSAEDQYQLYVMLGKVYTKAERFDRALAVYKKLQMQRADDANVLNSLGTVYRRLNMLPESIAVLKLADRLSTDKEAVLYNLGNTYKQAGVYDRAENCFRQVLALNKHDVLAYNHLGSIQALSQKYDASIETYRQGLKIDPNHPYLLYNLAGVLFKQNKLNQALAVYLQVQRARPKWKEVASRIAELYCKLGRVDDAIGAYRNLLVIEGKNAENLSALGSLFRQKGLLEQAQRWYYQALQKNPRCIDSLTALSDILDAKHLYTQALHVLEPELATASSKELFVKALHLCLKLKDYAKAKEIMRYCADEWQNDTEVLKIKGFIASLVGESDRAEESFSKMLDQSPGKIDFKRELAQEYIALERYGFAEELVLSYLKDRPCCDHGLVLLAMAYEGQQKDNEALATYQKALNQNALNSQALQGLARMQQKLTAAHEQPAEVPVLEPPALPTPPPRQEVPAPLVPQPQPSTAQLYTDFVKALTTEEPNSVESVIDSELASTDPPSFLPQRPFPSVSQLNSLSACENINSANTVILSTQNALLGHTGDAVPVVEVRLTDQHLQEKIEQSVEKVVDSFLEKLTDTIDAVSIYDGDAVELVDADADTVEEVPAMESEPTEPEHEATSSTPFEEIDISSFMDDETTVKKDQDEENSDQIESFDQEVEEIEDLYPLEEPSQVPVEKVPLEAPVHVRGLRHKAESLLKAHQGEDVNAVDEGAMSAFLY